ncbi:hypothetical protein [Streptomyces lanatus]|uniref:Secreted protein n=1 Tax=Streptomyces lanatus TaxID=66900 RepID=A0ABV1Y6D0_9ACTN|nr:hypothetical protein [Streptomyces lanatus]GHH30731.1 hypothetical protein GCM10018780_90590 [Streptomyces lanatus]
MRPKRTALPLAALAAAALVAVLAPEASALPLPLPAAGPESLVTEGLTVEGPLINNVSLPTLK